MEEELLDVEVLTALYGSVPQDVVVAVATAARPEMTIVGARILKYQLSLQRLVCVRIGKRGSERIRGSANCTTANVVELDSNEWTTEVKCKGTEDEA